MDEPHTFTSLASLISAKVAQNKKLAKLKPKKTIEKKEKKPKNTKERRIIPSVNKVKVNLVSNLLNCIDPSNISQIMYLSDEYFQTLLGKLPFPLPSTWPQDEVVILTNSRKRNNVERNALNYTSSMFLKDEKKYCLFLTFLLCIKHQRSTWIYKMQGAFAYRARQKTNAIAQLFAMETISLVGVQQ